MNESHKPTAWRHWTSLRTLETAVTATGASTIKSATGPTVAPSLTSPQPHDTELHGPRGVRSQIVHPGTNE